MLALKQIESLGKNVGPQADSHKTTSSATDNFHICTIYQHPFSTSTGLGRIHLNKFGVDNIRTDIKSKWYDDSYREYFRPAQNDAIIEQNVHKKVT